MATVDDDAASGTSFDVFSVSWPDFFFRLGIADSKSAGMLPNVTEVEMINSGDSYQQKNRERTWDSGLGLPLKLGPTCDFPAAL